MRTACLERIHGCCRAAPGRCIHQWPAAKCSTLMRRGYLSGVMALVLVLAGCGDAEKPPPSPNGSSFPGGDVGLREVSEEERKLYRDFGTAIHNKNMERLRELAQSSPDAVNVHDIGGHTPLFQAIVNRNVEAAKWLIENGADVNAMTNTGINPLKECIQTFDDSDEGVELVKRMLAAGADPGTHVKDGVAVHGFTALHYAAGTGSAEVARLLLEAGADPYALNRLGKTPLERAQEEKHTEVIKVLEQYHD